MAEATEKTGTFWDHLDDLRSCLIRIIVVTVAAAVVAFCAKEWLFRVILAPAQGDFFMYGLLGMEPVTIHLINTGLTEQFMMHLRAAFYAGMLVATPYILYVLFGFVSPGLYANERRYAVRLVGSSYVMFMLGTALNYLVIFPMAVRFLGTYQVSADVENMLTLESYMDTLVMMSLMMGVVFQLPVLCWLLAVLGIIRPEQMTRYRRHAIVVIVVVAAAITPTSDAFTLLAVSLPIWLLYELSIWVVRGVAKSDK